MYTNELPYEINKELCRLLDFKNSWKDLAGIWMEYSPFEITYVEQTAKGQERSPTDYLLQKWGQDIHKVEELFLFLYKMKNLAALVCLKPVVKKDLHTKIIKLKKTLNSMEKENEMDNEISRNKSTEQTNDSNSSIPWIVRQIEMGHQLPNTASLQNISLSTYDAINFSETSSSETNGISTDEITSRHVFAIPKISYDEVRKATDNWSEANLLGSGGFGQVFKGEWNYLTVAVKRLRNNDDNKELIREMCLNQYRHDNILPLYGYSIGGPQCVLVCQYMPGGSLLKRLKNTYPPLTWEQRYNIMLGVARGLLYLHTEDERRPQLIHGDIKPANILLDGNLTPKIGDFGAATLYRNNLKPSNVSKSKKLHGSWPYLPGEYLSRGILTPAVDVFSFGVVMLEVATALPVVDQSRKQQLLLLHIQELQEEGVDMASLEDPALRGSELASPALCRVFIDMGLHCTKIMRLRPRMLHVWNLMQNKYLMITKPNMNVESV